MPWQVKLNEQYPILEQILEGDVDDEGLQACLNEAVHLALISKRRLVLVDALHFLWPTFDGQKSIIFAHQDALGISELSFFDMSSFKGAYVTQSGYMKNKFWEVWITLLNNRGVKTNFFTDREQAIGWLMQPD